MRNHRFPNLTSQQPERTSESQNRNCKNGSKSFGNVQTIVKQVYPECFPGTSRILVSNSCDAAPKYGWHHGVSYSITLTEGLSPWCFPSPSHAQEYCPWCFPSLSRAQEYCPWCFPSLSRVGRVFLTVFPVSSQCQRVFPTVIPISSTPC